MVSCNERHFHTLFYSSKNENDQDNFVLYHYKVFVTKWKRIRNEVAIKPKSVTVKYHVTTNYGKEVMV